MRPCAARRLTVVLALALGFAAPARFLMAQSPSADWRTLETVHFHVHYPAPFDPWARHVAGSIEGIYKDVTQLVGYASPRPIDVLIADPLADANGVAIPYLDRPQVILWATPPGTESGLGDYTDWSALLVTHELAHIVHLTRPRNRSAPWLARLSPAPFGPLALSSPRWVAEGYATLVEGALTGSGRPASSFRAMVLRQFGLEGKLPSYAALNGGGGWLSGSMAYLAGSAYLEWLSAREGSDSLRNLWKRMASRRGGGFDASFRGVFGESPRDLYDRFRAEVTASAIAQQKRLEASGLVEGEPWQRLRGGTSAPQVSPDGARLLVRRDPAAGETYLAVWEIAETAEEARARERRRRRDESLATDPGEFVDKPREPEPRRPRWILPRRDGFSASEPRWMPDGKRVLFSRRSPDAEGVLHWDLFLWEPETGRVVRVTRGEDVAEADPAPDGRFAVGVRRRYGASTLVRVDLATGRTSALATDPSGADEWPVWSHPRFSPDGGRVAALVHREGRWRLVSLAAEGGAVRDWEAGGTPVAAPAWSADGKRLFATAEAAGIWNLFELPTDGGSPRRLTRVTGGAFSPAPSPDGRFVFFLDLTATGVDLRRLSLAPADSPLLPETGTAEAYPLLPPANPVPTAAASAVTVGASDAYRLWSSETIRPFLNFAVEPSGRSVQLGLDAEDVVGRLHLLAAGSVGDVAGPRGGTLAAAYRGLPVEISARLFWALERPGQQSLVRRPEFDQERRGGELEAVWWRTLSAGHVRVEAGAGATSLEALSESRRFGRFFGNVAAELAWRRTRGEWGFGATAEAAGSAGSTDGASWRQASAGLRLEAILPAVTLSGSARAGDTRGSPSRFDVFAIGGAPSLILPAGLDRNRVLQPALPADVQVGDRFTALRAELAVNAFPLVLYGDWLRAWNREDPTPAPVRVAGAELQLERLIPAAFDRSLTFRLGLARILSETPRLRSTRAYAGLVYRP